MSYMHMQAIAILIGIPAFAIFWEQTNWQTALALFTILYANNLSQRPPE